MHRIFGLPLIEWGRTSGSPSTAGTGGRRLWITSLDRLAVFPWRQPSGIGSAPVVSISGSAALVGSITAAFGLARLAPTATVTGAITATFPALAGGVLLSGSGTLVGQVTATFRTAPANATATVQGEIQATFYMFGGQQAGCISGPDTPPAGRPPNAVY